MLAGALIPFALLAGYEVWAMVRDQSSEEYVVFSQRTIVEASEEEHQASGQQNSFGLKVLAISLGVVGLMILILGLMSPKPKYWFP